MVTYEGELLHITSENTLTITLPEDENGEKVIPYVLSTADGVIYLTDGRNFNYYSMFPETENFQLLYKKDVFPLLNSDYSGIHKVVLYFYVSFQIQLIHFDTEGILIIILCFQKQKIFNFYIKKMT